jgi:hypothetical protein
VGAKVIKCECVYGIRSARCRVPAEWLVGVGQRQIDRQYSCTRHLSRTCWAMVEGEGVSRSITLTVLRVPLTAA